MSVHIPQCECGGQRTTSGVGSPLPQYGSWDWPQVVRLDPRYLLLMSHLAGPKSDFKSEFFLRRYLRFLFFPPAVHCVSSLAIIYGVFSASNLITPSVVAIVGPQISMFVSGLFYRWVVPFALWLFNLEHFSLSGKSSGEWSFVGGGGTRCSAPCSGTLDFPLIRSVRQVGSVSETVSHCSPDQTDPDLAILPAGSAFRVWYYRVPPYLVDSSCCLTVSN